jgi:hypothetical protein
MSLEDNLLSLIRFFVIPNHTLELSSSLIQL